MRSPVENENDVRFTMVSIGYKNNPMSSNFYYGTSGATKWDIHGFPSRDAVLKVY